MIKNIRARIVTMADTLEQMLDHIEKGFMEHKEEHLEEAMKNERSINDMEKELTKLVLDISKKAKSDKERKELVVLEQVVETLERMGDEASNLVERIEVKNAEHLLFSDMGVAQYNETYACMEKSVDMMCSILRGEDHVVKQSVVDNGFHVKELVERYRQEHMDRLVRGICTPIAANMFFDMLEFAGNIARHASNIVKLF